MKEITKDNKGITLIALIITIILMLILVSVTTYTGLNTYKNTRVNQFIAQMQLLQARIDDLITTANTEKLDNLQSVTTQKQESAINSAFSNGEVITNDISAYKVFTKDDILNILDVDDIQNDIMVNLETREIVSLVGIEYDGRTYYTQYKLPNGQIIINNDNSLTRDLGFEIELSVNGLNSSLLINRISITNGTLTFSETDMEGNSTNWQTITNYTEKDETYTSNISKSGNYTFKLQDNTDAKKTIEKTIVIVLTNKPKTNLELQPYNYGADSNLWAYVQDSNGLYYVWIPRFAYKTNSDTNVTQIKFIKGNSNIATDNTYISNDWILHKKFTASDGSKLTGVWISVDNPNQQGLNMIELLDSNATILTEI